MTQEELKRLNLPITLNDINCLYVESGLEWIKENTTITIEDFGSLPSGVKLFLVKFVTVMQQADVVSESVSGLSQSFDLKDREIRLREYARSFLGSYLKPKSFFFPCTKR